MQNWENIFDKQERESNIIYMTAKILSFPSRDSNPNTRDKVVSTSWIWEKTTHSLDDLLSMARSLDKYSTLRELTKEFRVPDTKVREAVINFRMNEMTFSDLVKALDQATMTRVYTKPTYYKAIFYVYDSRKKEGDGTEK
jgi:hypothetical protein